MSYESKIPHDVGALDMMLVLDELHKRGYQKLRWYSYMSPNGCALRCIISTQDNLPLRDAPIRYGHKDSWCTSVGRMKNYADVSQLVEIFIEENPELLERGKGEDTNYVNWYARLLSLAKEDNTPEFDGEFWSLPIGKIQVGKQVLPAPPMSIRLMSWNIDGIKAKFSDLQRLVAEYSPDVLCLQKVKNSGDSAPFELADYRLFKSVTAYAGVYTYVKPYILPTDDEDFKDDNVAKGHCLKVRTIYPALTIFNCYFPYSNPEVKGAVQHRRDYDNFIISKVHDTADRMILCGDLNIVHKDFDCWDSKYIRNQANFHNWEREDFEKVLAAGSLVDTYREFHNERGYTYFFRNDPEVRKNNQGHRIDYFLASNSLVPQIERADIITDVTASTNNPILLDISFYAG